MTYSIRNLIIVFLSLIPFVSFSQRIKQSINTSWQFHRGVEKDDNKKGYWEQVNIPHTWNVEDVMDDEPGYYRGIGWYQKELYIPEGWKDKNIYLYFEGASQVAEVFVNGKRAGVHRGSYLAFSFNITSLLNEGKNTIRVKVDNSHDPDIPPLGGDFSVYGGIYRDVYLIAVDKNHFDMDNYASSGVFISTPSVSEESASVQIRGKVSVSKKVKITTTIYDKEGKEVAVSETDPDKDGSFTVQVKNIKKPNLWSPENPYLYKVVNVLRDAKNEIVYDEVVNPLGFRWYHFDAEKGFYLNGKPYKIMGASRHQDFKGMGSALSDALHINDVQWLKDMGGNFLRVSHYPQDPAVMEACDRLGILTAVETPGNNQITESEVYTHNMLDMQREMIRQNYNHPSVVIWSYMNEVLIQPLYKDKTPEREKYWKNLHELALKMENLCRDEDKERYTMIAFHGDFDLYKKVGLIDIPKIAGWNLYQGWYGGKFGDFETFVLKHHKEFPLKPLIISEFGADSDYRLHSFSPVIFDKTQEYANLYHESYLKIIKKYAFIAGAIVWNLAEFGNESRQEAVPHINNKGLLTTDRKPKDSYFIYKAALAQQPFVKIGGSDWLYRAQQADPGSNTEATQPVTVYSNQKEVKLWNNGQLIGIQNVKDGKAVFACSFKNGLNTLKAVTDRGDEDLIAIDFHVIANQLKNTENTFTTLNVSLGDQRMFEDEVTKESWVPEQEYKPGSWGYVGGKVYREDEKSEKYGSRRNILGTAYDAMYETQRVGLKSFKADVPYGLYEITLHFAELLTPTEQEKLVYNLESNTRSENKLGYTRKFDVSLNGFIFLENLSDDNHLAPITAYSTKTTILVNRGQGITVGFIPHEGEAILNGIQLRKIF